MDRPLDGFKALRSRFTEDDEVVPGVPPGQPDRPHRSSRHQEMWDIRPVVFVLNGKRYEFFEIGALAKALNRSAVTIRAWEDWGALPPAVFRGPKRGQAKAGRRLYTRRQIVGIVRIAAEEGVGQDTKLRKFADTKFTERVIELFNQTPLGPEDEA